jgi:hypothetical protein
MKKEEEEEPIWTWCWGTAANRVSRRLIILVFYMSVIAGVLIVTIVFLFFQENKSHGVKPFALVLYLHACWTSHTKQEQSPSGWEQ